MGLTDEQLIAKAREVEEFLRELNLRCKDIDSTISIQYQPPLITPEDEYPATFEVNGLMAKTLQEAVREFLASQS